MRPVRPKTPKKPMQKFKTTVKDPIVVYCRLRPLENPLDSICIKAKDEKTVVLFQPEVSQNTRVIKEVHYSFSYVFNETTSQKELFDHVAYPLVQDLLNGHNGLLFTYGITSSGKTYTMTGTPYDGGLLPRSLDVIFNSIKDYQAPKFVFKPDRLNGFDIQSETEAMFDQQKEMNIISRTPKPKRKEHFGDWSNRVADSYIVEDVSPDMNYAVFVTYVEMYNNYIYDLLEEIPNDKRPNSKFMREDSARNMYVFGAVETEVKTVEEALEMFYKGQRRRKVSSTALNTESSRSHSVFTIRVVQAPLDPQGAEILQDKNQVIISQLSLVDLAGSERQVRTRNTNLKLREAGSINSSLMSLKICIEALRDSQTQGVSKMVPYRDSKLTHLFKAFFEGEGRIRMIVCVNPRADDCNETTHVMKFAEMTQDVMIQRPTPVSTPSTLGMKTGRGNIYREAVRKAREQGVALTEVLVPTMYSLGPDFPSLTDFEDEAAVTTLVDFLCARMIRRNTFEQDLSVKQEEFRKLLLSLDKENIQLKMENTRLQDALEFREQQMRGLERKLTTTEQTLEVVRGQLLESQTQVECEKSENYNKDRRIAEQDKEMARIKARTQEKLASEKDRLRRLVERRLAAKEVELQRKMCFTDEKFRQLREILNADDYELLGDIWPNGPPPAPPSVTSTATSEVSTPEPRRSKRKSDPSETQVKFSKVRSATDLVHARQNTPQSSHTPSSRNDFDSLFAKENKAPTSSQRSLAIANLRHRRSQSSSGEVWVDHKPIGNLELNTLLQPKMKKKKSVTQLNVKDVINKDSSRYLLQHQEQDSQGEVITELYKADIIPSAGGGAQVVFNDVETLQQTSPSGYNLRKRSGDSVPLREIEQRCTTAIECHGLNSKLQKKK